MEQFGFERLHEDDQLEVLKYMPSKERVRFERNNKYWARLLDRLWLSQKQLHFGGHLVKPSKCHPIGLIDQSPDEQIAFEVILKVISECKNLKALSFSSNTVVELDIATQLANVLNDNCEKLVHIRIPSISIAFFEMFIPSDKFSCLLPLRYDRLKLVYDKRTPARPLCLKTVQSEAAEVNPMTWNLINKKAVECLVFIHWNMTFNELINLKSVEVFTSTSNQIGNFHELEHITLFNATTTGLRRIFESNRNLVSLKLYRNADELLDTVLEFGIKLKKLNVCFDDVAVLDDYEFWNNLAKLTKLRSLVIEDFFNFVSLVTPVKLNVNGLTLLLETCTKLKYFKLCYHSNGENITKDEKEQIRNLMADRSFRQSYEVKFTSGSNYHKIVVKLGHRVLKSLICKSSYMSTLISRLSAYWKAFYACIIRYLTDQ